MQIIKKWIPSLLVLFIVSGCGGDPKIPGETEKNPLKFTARGYADKKMEIEKKYLAIEGIPLTALYSFTYKKGKPGIEANADNFYFPIIPPDFEATKDSLAIFAYCSTGTFNKITDNLKNFYKLTAKPKTTTGTRSDFLYAIPAHIVEAYEKNKIKVAPSEKRLTIKLISIN